MSNEAGLGASHATSVTAAAPTVAAYSASNGAAAAVAPAPEPSVSAAAASDNVHSDSDSDSDCSSEDDAEVVGEKGGNHRKISESAPRSSTAQTTDGKKKKKGDKGSCHQCKTIRETKFLLGCTSKAEKGKRKRKCRKRYCAPCLQRTYSQTLGNMTLEEIKTWQCPSCMGICTCAACQRRSMMTKVVESIPLALTTLGMLPVPLGVNGLPMIPMVPAPHQLLPSQAGFVDPYFAQPMMGMSGAYVPPALGGHPGMVAPPAAMSFPSPPLPLLPFVPPNERSPQIPTLSNSAERVDDGSQYVDQSLQRQPFTIPPANPWIQASSPSPRHGPARSMDHHSPHLPSPSRYAASAAAADHFLQRRNQPETAQQYQSSNATHNPSFATTYSATNHTTAAPTSADPQDGFILKSNSTAADRAAASSSPLPSHHLSRSPVAKLVRLQTSDNSHDTLSYRWPNAPSSVPRRTRTIQMNQESTSRPSSSTAINTMVEKSLDEDIRHALHQPNAAVSAAMADGPTSAFNSTENPQPSPELIPAQIPMSARSASDRQQLSTSSSAPSSSLPIPPNNTKPHSSHAFSFTTMRDRRLSETNRSVSSDQLPTILRGNSRSGASSVGSGGSVIDGRIGLNSPMGSSMADALVGLDLSQLEPAVLKALHENLQVQLERRGMAASVISNVDRHSSTSNNSDSQPPPQHQRSMSYDAGSVMATDEPNQTMLNASVSPVQRGGRAGAYSVSSGGSSGGRRDSSRKRKQPSTLSHGQHAADMLRNSDAFYSSSPSSSSSDRGAPTPNTAMSVAERRQQVMEKLRNLQGSNRSAMEAIGIKNLDSLDLTHLSLQQLDALVVLLTPSPMQQQQQAPERSQNQQQQRISPECEQSPNSPFDPVKKRQNSDSKDLSDRSTPQLNQIVSNPSTSPTIHSPAFIYTNNGMPPPSPQQPPASAQHLGSSVASHQFIPPQSQSHLSGVPVSPTSPASKTVMLQQQLHQLESQLQELQQQQMRFQLTQQSQQLAMANSSNHPGNPQLRYSKSYPNDSIDSQQYEQQQELLRRQQQRLLRHQLQQQSARFVQQQQQHQQQQQQAAQQQQQQQLPLSHPNHAQEMPVSPHYMNDANVVAQMPPSQPFPMPIVPTVNNSSRHPVSHHVDMNVSSGSRPMGSHSNLSLNTSALAMTTAMFSPFDDGMAMGNYTPQPQLGLRGNAQSLLPPADPNNPLSFLSPQLQQTTPPASSIQSESENRPVDGSTASTSQCMSASPIKNSSPMTDNVVGRLPVASNPSAYLQNGLITPSPIDPLNPSAGGLNFPRSGFRTSSSYSMFPNADLSMEHEDYNALN